MELKRSNTGEVTNSLNNDRNDVVSGWMLGADDDGGNKNKKN